MDKIGEVPLPEDRSLISLCPYSFIWGGGGETPKEITLNTFQDFYVLELRLWELIFQYINFGKTKYSYHRK